MESIIKHPGQVSGFEVLYFENAEIEKVKGNQSSFGSFGPLSVLYFPSYHRFVLRINDWKYPLMRRLPIISSSRTDLNSRTYMLPAGNGSFFNLKLDGATNLNSLTNFETILGNFSNFSYKGEDISPFKKVESSPDDKLARYPKQETGITTMISETLKSAGEKIMSTAKTFTHGTKHVTSKKTRSNLKNIKPRNFKKEAKTHFKKNFFAATGKLSTAFLQKRRENPFLSSGRSMEDMLKANEKMVPVVYLSKEEIEEAIFKNKDLASQGSHNMGATAPQKGFMESLKQGFQDVRQAISGTSVSNSRVGQGPMEAHGGRGRTMPTTEQTQPMPQHEGMTHLSG